MLGTSNADGVTPLRVQADPADHALKVEDDTTGNDLSGDVAPRDSNGVVAIMAVSEVDGVTPVQVYIKSSTNELLIKST